MHTGNRQSSHRINVERRFNNLQIKDKQHKQIKLLKNWVLLEGLGEQVGFHL